MLNVPPLCAFLHGLGPLVQKQGVGILRRPPDHLLTLTIPPEQREQALTGGRVDALPIQTYLHCLLFAAAVQAAAGQVATVRMNE